MGPSLTTFRKARVNTDAEIEELKAKIAELENEPAAKDVEQEFANAKETVDNSPKGKMAKRGYKF